MNFWEELKEQRWDDHRYYHHSRVNQALHLLSALTFLCTYVLLWTDPVTAALLGWFVAMVPRQIGHFFFEPKSYDVTNQATHEYKEEIKVGYNLRRKIVLMVAWVGSPVALYYSPNLFGILAEFTDTSYMYRLSIMWIALGVIALLFRTIHLFFIKGIQSGLVWCTKILTDPFHDLTLYYKAPYHLLKGEWMDPMYVHSNDEDQLEAKA